MLFATWRSYGLFLEPPTQDDLMHTGNILQLRLLVVTVVLPLVNVRACDFFATFAAAHEPSSFVHGNLHATAFSIPSATPL